MSSQQSRQQTTSGSRRAPSPGADQAENYYRLLNVPYDAPKTQITRAYRQSMMRAHPDRALPSRRATAEETARLLNLAYATLSDPDKRKRYDESIRAEALQDEIMGRYVSGLGGHGFGGPRATSAHVPRRTLTERERKERAQSDRSALISIFSAFGLIALAAVALLLLFTLGSLAFSLVF